MYIAFWCCDDYWMCSFPVKQTLEYPPVVTFESPESGSEFNVGDEITFVASVFDDNQTSDTLQIVWNSDKDLILDETPASIEGEATLTISSLSATHIIQILRLMMSKRVLKIGYKSNLLTDLLCKQVYELFLQTIMEE